MAAPQSLSSMHLERAPRSAKAQLVTGMRFSHSHLENREALTETA